MTDLAVGDITYTMQNQRKMSDSRSLNRVKLAFGDGALTYPAGGIPLSIGKLGCPTIVESLVVYDQGTSGYKFSFDQANSKLVITQSPVRSHTHDIKVIGGGTIVTNGSLGVDSGSGLVKVAATNGTIAGANSTTLGGVVSATLAAAASTEASAVAIAAQAIYVEVIGW